MPLKPYFIKTLLCAFLLFFAFNHTFAAGISTPKTVLNNTPTGDTCDVIAFHNGKIVRGKVLSVTKDEIQFRLCGEKDNTRYTQEPRNVLSILYADGRTQTFEASAAEAAAENNAKRANKTSVTLGITGAVIAVIGLIAFLLKDTIQFFTLLAAGLSILLGTIGAVTAPKRKNGETLSYLAILFGLVVGALALIIRPTK
jgi:hypothetical protein